MSEFDLVVIGAGPGGYVAAIRAAQLGLKVAVVDQRGQPGGTCFHIGCIPSKALLQSSLFYSQIQTDFKQHGILCNQVFLDLEQMLSRKTTLVNELAEGIHSLFRKQGIVFIQGKAIIETPQKVAIAGKNGVFAKNILIASGATPIIPEGVEIDEEHIVTSTGALNLKKVPRHLVVVGGGYIGLELGSVWLRLGSAVTVVESQEQIVSNLDEEMRVHLQQALTKQGMVFKFARKLSRIVKNSHDLTMHFLPIQATPGSIPEMMGCDAVLFALGRKPSTENLGLDNVGIEMDHEGFIRVNSHWQTSCPTIYAIGDVTRLGPMLAHRAGEEGVALAEHLAGQKSYVNYELIPSVIYTSPQVASVGKTEEELKNAGVAYRVGKFPFSANERAKIGGQTSGFVKVLIEETRDSLLGVHIIGPEAETLIAEAALALAFGGSAKDIARMCHAHPTYAEVLKEAALAAYDQPIHI